MENTNYNSLTDRLIQNGILSEPEKLFETSKNNNFFKQNEQSDKSASEIEQSMPRTVVNPINKKRLNKNELEIVKSFGEIYAKENSKKSFFNRVFSFVCPKIFKARQIKIAMKKLSLLNISESELFDKTIPYGENDQRYSDLVKYLSCANELQVQFRRNNN